jgi:drug/metabolite transporter (DMT)-like permease
MSVVWGIPYLLIRVAVRHLDPGVLVFGRTAPAGLLMLLVVLGRGQFAVLRQNLKWIVLFGVVEIGIPWYLMGAAEKHITSSLTSLLICCVPLLAVVVGLIRRTEERITPRRLAGLVVGALGVAFLVGLDLGGGSFKWIGMIMLVCLGYTVGPIILARKLPHVPGYVIVAGATSFVALCWTPWTVGHWPEHISSETWSCVAVLSLVCTAGAFVVFHELVRTIGSSRSVVVTYFNTAVAVVLGIVFLSEPLTAGIIVGFPLVLIGCIFATSTKAPVLSEVD